jgi:hypothetical protein
MALLPAKVLTIGAAAALAAVPLAGCGSDDASSPGRAASSAASRVKNALDPVAQAAEVTGAQKGGIAMTVDGRVTAAGQTIPIKGNGTFDKGGRLGQMSMTTSVMGRDMKIDEITQDHVIYMTSDLFRQALPSGKSWIKIDLDAAAKDSGIDLSALTGAGGGASQDPTQALEYLKGAGRSTEVGDETINGVATRHYHVDVDLEKVGAKGGADGKKAVQQLERLSGLRTLPVDVWVDKDHLVRREAMKYDMTVQGQRTSMSMTIDMTKYGVEVTARPPKDSDTIDAQELLGSLGRGATSSGSGTTNG